jgi:hypothetical protein
MLREIPSDNLDLHICRVTKKYRSGLMDVISSRDSNLFRRVSVLENGTSEHYSEGDTVVVLSDGAQHVVMGKFNLVRADVEGKPTILEEDDLYDVQDKKVMSVKDSFGHLTRVVVSKGAGILLDTGAWCMSHLSPGINKLTHFVERFEIISPGLYSLIDHDGRKASAHYIFKTVVDHDSMKKELDHSPSPDQIRQGETLEVRVKGENDVVEIKLRRGGVVQMTMEIEKDGTVKLNSSSKVIVTSDDVRLGDGTATKRVALAEDVKAEIDRLVSHYRTHNHSYILPLIPAGPSITTPGSHATYSPINPNPAFNQGLGASKVKAK